MKNCSLPRLILQIHVKYFINAPPSINEILSEFLISDIDYYNVLAISKNDDYELHLIRSSDLGFVNNYFEDSFGAW